MKLNIKMAYALAYVLQSKHKAKIAAIGENETNFYVDFDSKEKISIDSFKELEKEIFNFIYDRNVKVEAKQKATTEVAKCKCLKGNKYLAHWVKENKTKTIKMLKINDDFSFVNYLTDTKNLNFNEIKSFKLENVSGVYWLAKAKNKQLQRITGYAFDSKEELKAFEAELKDRKERDHRKIGQDLELFTFDDLAGQGAPIWLPNGTAVMYEIDDAVRKTLNSCGFHFVSTPVLGSSELYKTSGHWFHYRENMFSPLKIDKDVMVLRPMTCPHHMLVYKSKPRSYRELPYRIAEKAILHRYEASGALIGLERVRNMQLIDTHVIIRPDQIESEIRHYYDVIMKCLKMFDIKLHRIDLSLHDPKDKAKYFDNPTMWAKAEKELEACMKRMNMAYEKKVGEAAFYGPKIDFQMKTALGHIITMSTIQLDFLLPDRFKLEYIDQNGKTQRPILIHGGIIGTLERFMSILLESNKGVFPLWLAPIQVQLIPVVEKHVDFCNKLAQKLLDAGIRVNVDNSDERLGKKIRNAQIKKIPYQIVIGDEEIKSGQVAYRQYGKQDVTSAKFDDFIKLLQNRIAEHK